jgi:hypothetical protein
MFSRVNNASSFTPYDDIHRIGFLSFMVGSGFWYIINKLLFKKFRHSLLYNPSEGGSHEVLVTAIGKGLMTHIERFELVFCSLL